MSSSTDEPPFPRRKSSARGLQRFDTSAFTLQAHCGPHVVAVRDCLRAHKVEMDPVALEERGWDLAPECKHLWESYRQCGLNFFSATDWAQSRCSVEAEKFQKCSPRMQGAEYCKELELALARCATKKIRMKMSGEKELPSAVES